MKWAALTWSSPLQRGVQETSPIPTRPLSAWTLTNKNGETECEPPRPLRIASSGLMGTRIGIVSSWLIFIFHTEARRHRDTEKNEGCVFTKLTYPMPDAGSAT